MVVLCVGGGENYYIIYKELCDTGRRAGRREDAKSPQAPSLRGTRKNSTKTPSAGGDPLARDND